MTTTIRPMWRGALDVGILSLEVGLVNAVDTSERVRTHHLHAGCGARLCLKGSGTWCPAEDRLVPRSEIAAGYEYAPDQYVVIDDEDLEPAPARPRSIVIDRFVPRSPAAGLDPTLFATATYYLAPESIGRRAYYLLLDVLERRDVRAIARVCLGRRESLAAIDASGDVLVLRILRWPDEVRRQEALGLPVDEVEYSEAELALAEQLVDGLTGAFEPERYRDEYTATLRRVIDGSMEHADVEAGQDAPGDNVVDLMAALAATVASRRAAMQPPA